MRNKTIIICILSLFLSFIPAEKVMATDYTLLEMLIEFHKNQSDKLKKEEKTTLRKQAFPKWKRRKRNNILIS